MKTRFVPPDGKTHRVGNRLVNAGNAELAGSCAVGLARQRDRIADAKLFGRRELARDEDCRQLLALRDDARYGPCDREDRERRQKNQESVKKT